MPEFRTRTFVGSDGPPITRLVCYFRAGGELWSVYEDQVQRPPHDGPSLVFETDRVARRVHRFPASWRDLRDDQLYALSWGD